MVPPPLNTPYLQYGVAFTAEVAPFPGGLCPSGLPCILGSGGGIAARVGRRSAGPWYFGGAYEITKQDPAKLLRLATLQQLRAEARYYVTTGRDTQPYFAGGAGVVGYGNEGGIQTYGPNFYLGVGLETQLSRRTVVGFNLGWRVMDFIHPIRVPGEGLDASQQRSGLAQMFGIDLTLEGRDPI